jgi:hypothetical protein
MPSAQPLAEVPQSRHADRTSVFQIFQNRLGRWYALRADGMVLGIFFKREDAVRFARRESSEANALKFVLDGSDGRDSPARPEGWPPRLVKA